MALPTAGSTSTLGPVGTTVQALSIPNPSSNIPQRTPIGVLLLAVSYEPRPTRAQLFHIPATDDGGFHIATLRRTVAARQSGSQPGATPHGMDRRPRLGEGTPQRCPGEPASSR